MDTSAALAAIHKLRAELLGMHDAYEAEQIEEAIADITYELNEIKEA